jgi:hypothetical protein
MLLFYLLKSNKKRVFTLEIRIWTKKKLTEATRIS